MLLNCSCKAAEPDILFRPREIPSINPKMRPPTTAAPNIAAGPWRTCNKPPVMKPLPIEFHGSSFCRINANEQSTTENIPPHAAKPAPVSVAFCLTLVKLPANLRRYPY